MRQGRTRRAACAARRHAFEIIKYNRISFEPEFRDEWTGMRWNVLNWFPFWIRAAPRRPPYHEMLSALHAWGSQTNIARERNPMEIELKCAAYKALTCLNRAAPAAYLCRGFHTQYMYLFKLLYPCNNRNIFHFDVIFVAKVTIVRFDIIRLLNLYQTRSVAVVWSCRNVLYGRARGIIIRISTRCDLCDLFVPSL